MDYISDWRVDEEDEPEASDEEVFGAEKPQDRLTAALDRVAELARDSDAETLDRQLVATWVKRMRASGNVAEAERFADYLAA